MRNLLRLGVVCLSALSVAAITDSAFAQRFNFGQQNSNNNRNRDNDDRDEDDEEESNSNQQGNRSSRTRGSTNEQIQQFLQRRQGGQNNQNNQNQGQGGTQQFRNRQGGQFQDGQNQEGQFRTQDGFQFQQFRPEANRQNSLRFGGWQGNQWQGSRDIEKWTQVFRGGQKPFSKEWYQSHPKAWKHDHDDDNFWVAASLPGVYGWLGWGDAPVQPGVRFVRPDYSRFHNFYPLGVFSLMSGPGDMGTRIVQLAIDRHGHIAGNYYDLITDTNSSVSGDVRRDSQRVYWSLNKNPSIRFRASLARLMQPYGTVVVQMPGGEQDWQFVRLEY